MKNEIIIKNAKENNLKGIDLTIPRDKLVLFTGISGSGKSSLAFDTIFAEGQRRYIESLSAYARQFLGQMDKPDVESIEGLSPAISIDQKTTSSNPRSTVGTVTEIYDYLRLLYARVGTPYCPNCGKEIKRQTVDQIADKVAGLGQGAKIQILAPVVRGRKGEFQKLFESLKKQGFVRVNVDGEQRLLEEEIKLEKTYKHTISVVVDRLSVKEDMSQRLYDSLETALKLAEGLVVVKTEDSETMYSEKLSCPDCGVTLEELEPRMFSFNSPFGACPDCTGLGFKREFEPDLVIPDKTKSLSGGAVKLMGFNLDGGVMQLYFKALAKRYGFDLNAPVKDLPDEIMRILLWGNDGEPLSIEYQTRSFEGQYTKLWHGLIPTLERRYNESTSDTVRREYENYMVDRECPTCHGKRLKKEVLSVKIGGKNIYELTQMSVEECAAFFENLRLDETKTLIARMVLKEINARLKFLKDVGLDYLTLARSSGSLSGGEAQRIRLATQIGSGLVGVLYILDEPSIGLHQRDNEKLIDTLLHLRDLGNTLIVVEHDEDTIRAADFVVDVGPGAGVHGGEIVATGTPGEIMACPRSVTGQYLSGAKKYPYPKRVGRERANFSVSGRAQKQSEKSRRGHTLGRAQRRYGSFRQRQEQSGKRNSQSLFVGKAQRRAAYGSGMRLGGGIGASRQGNQHRPKPDRTHAAQQSRDLYGDVYGNTRFVRFHTRRQRTGLQGGTFFLQRGGRQMRKLRRRRHTQNRNELSARRVRSVRGVSRHPLQSRNIAGQVQGQKHCRRSGYAR